MVRQTTALSGYFSICPIELSGEQTDERGYPSLTARLMEWVTQRDRTLTEPAATKTLS